MTTTTAPRPVRYGDATWPAIGTTARVLVTEAQRLGDAVEVVATQLERLDRAASRFRADSEVSALASGRVTRVSPLLLTLVQAAVRAARITGGAVDPTVGGALAALGYDRDFATVPGAASGGLPGPDGDRPGAGLAAGPSAGADRVPGPEGGPGLVVRSVPGWRSVSVDPSAGTVRVPAGVVLDLGSTARAWAADRAAADAAAAAGCGVLVSLGGDVAVAGECPPGGWLVHLADDSAAAPGPGCRRSGSVPAGWPRPRPRSAGGAAAGSACTTSSIR